MNKQQLKVVSREAWLRARLDLLKAEKELTRRNDELTRQRQELPWVRIDKEYRFDTDEGNASLKELFRGVRLSAAALHTPTRQGLRPRNILRIST